MPTEPVKAAETPDADETELRAELEADGELLDDTGKPLPWNHPKRVRRIYKEAKDGRKSSATLKDLGIKAGDLPAIISEYREFKTAYADWQEKQAKGTTTDDDDEEAKAAKQQGDKLRKAIKSLGFKLESEDAEKPVKPADARKSQVISSAFDKMAEVAEEMGFDLDAMESKARSRFMRNLDNAVGDLLEDDNDAREAFVKEGSLRPIAKFARKVLESQGEKSKGDVKLAPKGTGIKNLPPRASSSSAGSSAGKKPEGAAPANTKEATDQLVEALKARRLAPKEE